MSDNALSAIIIGCVFGFFTLRALFEAWSERGVARHKALAAQYGDRNTLTNPGADQASAESPTRSSQS